MTTHEPSRILLQELDESPGATKHAWEIRWTPPHDSVLLGKRKKLSPPDAWSTSASSRYFAHCDAHCIRPFITHLSPLLPVTR